VAGRGQIDLKRAQRTLQQEDLHGTLGPQIQPNCVARSPDGISICLGVFFFPSSIHMVGVPDIHTED
jgi:hypothetical protein